MAAYPPEHHILTSLAIEVRKATGGIEGRCLVDGRFLRPSLGSLVPMVDMIAGSVAARHADGDWMATSNLWISERSPLDPDGGPLGLTNRLLRAGKRLIVVVSEVTQSGRPIASATAEFARIRRDAALHEITPAKDSGDWKRFGSGPLLDQRLDDACGIEIVGAATGVARLAHHSFVSNSIGTIQGGAAALLADAAACAMIGGGARVVDLSFRFLAQTGVGPAETRGEVLRSNDLGATIKLEVVDAADGTLVGWAIAQVEAARR